jgi:hypothetical protein
VKLTIGETTAYVDGQPIELEQPGVIVNDHTLVPVRFIGESFNSKVEWDSRSRTVILKDMQE